MVAPAAWPLARTALRRLAPLLWADQNLNRIMWRSWLVCFGFGLEMTTHHEVRSFLPIPSAPISTYQHPGLELFMNPNTNAKAKTKNPNTNASSTNPANSTGQSRLFVGIDIAADTATAAWITSNSQMGTGTGTQAHSQSTTPTKPLTFDQTPAGFALLMNKLRASGVAAQDSLVVLEATSTYWIVLASTLHEAGYQVSVVNPAQAHHFAKALLKRAKTDKLDALTLAALAQALQPPPWTPPPVIYHELQQRLALRDSLLNMRGQVRNQLHALQHNLVVIPSVHAQMQELIQSLEEQIHRVEAELKTVIQNDAEWGQAIARLQSIKGIGLLTASWLVVSTLNFSSCPNVSSLCSYMGLAPMPRQSGSSVRGRASIGHSGKGRGRRALYMATLSAARYNPPIRAFYQRLRAAGKPEKVARCAAARKMLVIAWAIAKQGTKFDPTYQPQPASAAQPKLAAAGRS